MGKKPTKAKTDIDADLVRKMADLLDETGLTEIEYGADGWHLRVARQSTASAPVQVPAQPPQAAAAATPEDTAADDDEVDASHPGVVTAPMVGVVYTGPEPGAPAFVKTGDKVTEGQTLLVIEAMKMFNPIKAPHAGSVTRILVGNATPVEFGEPLIIIE